MTRDKCAVCIIGGAIVAATIGAMFFLFKGMEGNLTSVQSPDSNSESAMARIRATYENLMAEMIRDFDADANAGVLILSSNAHVFKHPNYARLVALGKPAVPIAMSALQANNYDYSPEILRGLLPEVDLGKLYGDKDYNIDSVKLRKYWLRWWNDYGSKQRWADGRHQQQDAHCMSS